MENLSILWLRGAGKQLNICFTRKFSFTLELKIFISILFNIKRFRLNLYFPGSLVFFCGDMQLFSFFSLFKILLILFSAFVGYFACKFANFACFHFIRIILMVFGLRTDKERNFLRKLHFLQYYCSFCIGFATLLRFCRDF